MLKEKAGNAPSFFIINVVMTMLNILIYERFEE